MVLRVTSSASEHGLVPSQALSAGGARTASLAMLTQTGVNQDGRSSSLTAPNGPSQQALVSDVLLRAGLHGGMLARLEMHGTGTSLGDPIEVGAALEVLAPPVTVGDAFIAHTITLEGAKPRVGHCEPGAGVAGVLFSLSSLTQRHASSLVHLRHLNPHVEAATTRAQIGVHARAPVLPRQLAGRPIVEMGTSDGTITSYGSTRRSGVSGFAFQGTNAHAILSHDAEARSNAMYGYVDTASTCLRTWERRRYWCAPARHCLIERVSSLWRGASDPVLARSYTRLRRSSALSHMRDNVVGDMVLLPGAGHVELCRALVGVLSSDTCVDAALRHVAFIAPLELRLDTEIACDVDSSGVIRIGAVTSSSSTSRTALRARSTSRVSLCPARSSSEHLSTPRTPAAPASSPHPCVPCACARARWVHYSVPHAQARAGHVYGSIGSWHELSMSSHAYYASPPMLDAALHALSACAPMRTPRSSAQAHRPAVPASIGGVRAQGGLSTVPGSRFSITRSALLGAEHETSSTAFGETRVLVGAMHARCTL